ncbi:MAG: hypothetical protein SAK29_41940 [Scytonema sp. PMC 1069.18]|nr:hypothetical protein [Scytonema sp. PMC 1069.18]MEC4887086.1 hypothetical protein [Scytonema sp. PMC 1070.18]
MKTFELVTGTFYQYLQTKPIGYKKFIRMHSLLLMFLRPCQHCNAYLFCDIQGKIYQLQPYTIKEEIIRADLGYPSCPH